MISSKREKIIVVVLAAVVAAYLLGSFVFAPYLDEHNRLSMEIQKASDKVDLNKKLLNNRSRVDLAWKQLALGGLKSNPAETESQTQHALLNWAQAAHLELESQKADRAKQSGDFQQIRFDATCSGTVAGVTQMLLAMETTTLPLQLDDVHITARKEGTNSIEMQFSVTALVFSPLPPKPVKAPIKKEET